MGIFSAGFPRWHSGKESAWHCRICRRHRFDSWVGNILWRRKWQPTPVFLPEKFHEQKSLAGYSSWGHQEWDMTEQLSTHFFNELYYHEALHLSSPSPKTSYWVVASLSQAARAQGHRKEMTPRQGHQGWAQTCLLLPSDQSEPCVLLAHMQFDQGETFSQEMNEFWIIIELCSLFKFSSERE